MPIDGMERLAFQVAIDDQQSHDQNNKVDQMADDVIRRIKQKAAEQQAGVAKQVSKEVGTQEVRTGQAREAAPRFQSIFNALLNGAAGPDKQRAALAMNTPVFQRAPNSVKEEVTAKIQSGEIGYDSASSFGRLTGDPKADAALNSAEASGAVLRVYTRPQGDLGKVENTVKEFIENFAGGPAGSDPKANARILNANLQAPGDDILGLLNKGLGNNSYGGKNLSGLAKETVASQALKEALGGMKPGQSVTKQILDTANNPVLLKKLTGGEMSKLATVMARTPDAAVPIDKLLKSEKFFNMSARVREGQVAFIGKQSSIAAFKTTTNLGATLPDKLATLPRTSKQMRALSLLLASKGEVDEDELDNVIARARRKEIIYPDKREYPDPSDPDYQKEVGAELAQWMALKQRTLQANRKVEQRIKGCKSGAELRQQDPLKSWQALDLSGRPPEIQAAVQRMNQEIEAELKKQRLTYSKQMKITRGVKIDVSAVRERAPSHKPVPTTFRLPDNAGGANTTFSVAKLVGTLSATEVAGAAETTTTSAAAPVSKNRGWGITLGMDRDRQFFSGRAVKPPPGKTVTTTTETSAPPSVAFTKGGAVRSLDQLTENRWIELSVKERSSLRNLQIDRRIFETLSTDRPIVPALMINKAWSDLSRLQQGAALDLGMSENTWNANRDRCVALLGSASPRPATKNVQMKRPA